MEHVACPLCGADKSVFLFRRKDLSYSATGDAFTVVRCPACGLAYVDPRPTLEEIGRYYPPVFYRSTLTREDLLRDQHKQLLLTLRHMPLAPPGRLLDIGCSRGEFLHVMAGLGWEVQGVEFSENAHTPFAVPIFRGTLEAAEFAPASFDCVTLWAVLEHIHAPLPLLRRAWALLKPGGHIVLAVTNMRSLPGRFMRLDDVPRHLILFHPPSLRRMLREAGFDAVRLRFDSALFGGTHRGLLNFLVKRLAREKTESILEANRDVARWSEFSSMLRGRASRFMLAVDSLDIRLFPYVDAVADALGLGHSMLAVARKPA